MSVILDALRKLDREKSSRRSGTAPIAVEILRPDLSHPWKKIPVVLAAVCLTAIAAAAITYVLVSAPGFPSKSSPPVPVSLSPSSQQATPVPLFREPVRDAQDQVNRLPPKIKIPAESKPTETSSGEKKTTRNVVSEEAKAAPENTKKTVEHPTGSTTTPPSLKISAIVWYEDPSKRFAMINGTIATEGSLIEGVKVVEINPTAVRFLHNGQHFEIPISK